MASPNDTVEMALMGMDTSIIAPLIVLAARSWPGWRRLVIPAALTLPLFLLAHAAITVWMVQAMPGPGSDLGFQAGLIVVSVWFWLPVFGPARRLSDAGRTAYLFLAMPTMDLAGVYVIVRGDAAGGLAMIVAMLPIGLLAVALTWHWILTEAAAETAVTGVATDDLFTYPHRLRADR
ncbi:MAG TPA: hypothetical protein VGF84_08620 [Micromonosporaceae bacterium]